MTNGKRVPLGRLRIAVLSGGESAEREISLESGDAVCRALAGRGHRIISIDPAMTDLSQYDWSEVDAVFIALHGTYGEDGQVQAILERASIPFTGSDSAASQLSFSKSASKERFTQCHLPTPAYVLIHETDNAAWIGGQAKKLGFPLVVKPDAQGSSLGVSIAKSPKNLPQALTECFHYDAFGLLETVIEGSEWTVGFLNDRALPLIQIETGRPFFDYNAKYTEQTTQYLFDFALPTNIVKSIEQTARSACEALGTSGLSRVDLRLDKYQRPWLLEVNTIPGLTEHSLIPKAAARLGIDLGELCEQAVTHCQRQAEARQRS